VTANKYLPFTAYFSLFTAFSTRHLLRAVHSFHF
jgi:hypothetical protein